MQLERREPGQRGEASDGEAGANAARAQPQQYGPVVVRRHAKDDGRTLLLYARDDAKRE